MHQETLPPIAPTRKDAAERFRSRGSDLGFTLLESWRWSASDLMENTTRWRNLLWRSESAPLRLASAMDGRRTTSKQKTAQRPEVKSSSYIVIDRILSFFGLECTGTVVF